MQRILFFCFLFCCQASFAQSIHTEWNGVASYYHSKFNGRKTASGDVFRSDQLSAASNRIPMGTRVEVTNIRTHQSVQVIVNDRMSAHNKRLIDLSEAAARQIGLYGHGLTQVHVVTIEKGTQMQKSPHPKKKRKRRHR
jgi:rare lipoprotein A